jgi:hypothetical protein
MQEELEGEPSTPEELAAATFTPHLNNFQPSGGGSQALIMWLFHAGGVGG